MAKTKNKKPNKETRTIKPTPSTAQPNSRAPFETPKKTHNTTTFPLGRAPPRADASLYAYLASFDIETPSIASDAVPGLNTRSAGEYSYTDIQLPVARWEGFSAAACHARFAEMLHGRDTRVTAEPASVSPQKGIAGKELFSESCVVEFLGRSLTVHLNRALEASTAAQNQLQDRPGAVAVCTADRVGVAFQASVGGGRAKGQREVRLVGDVKVSWKWRSEWRDDDAPAASGQRMEYRQVLSQVHFYMNRAGCRWGYIVTDREFVALKRGERFGELLVADAVPVEGGKPGWNVAFAAWYLHMMAADDGGEWSLPTSVKPQRKITRLAQRLEELQAQDDQEERPHDEQEQQPPQPLQEVEPQPVRRRSPRLAARALQ